MLSSVYFVLNGNDGIPHPVCLWTLCKYFKGFGYLISVNVNDSMILFPQQTHSFAANLLRSATSQANKQGLSFGLLFHPLLARFSFGAIVYSIAELNMN
jgi:hypothetical protein